MANNDSEGPRLQLNPAPEKQSKQEASPHTKSLIFLVAIVAATSLLPLCYAALGKNPDINNALGFTHTKADDINSATKAEIDAKFAVYTGKLVPLNDKDAELKAEFMASPYLEADVKKEMWLDIEAGRKKLGVVSVWDNFEEDGDAVAIQAGGVMATVPIFHTPARVLFPYTPGEPLTITGLRDGGGGVTAAIETGSGPVPLPPLSVGQTIVLPLL